MGILKENKLMPDYGHPRSRDWGLPDLVCKRLSCIANTFGHCFIPSKCEINDEGKCEGYKRRD